MSNEETLNETLHYQLYCPSCGSYFDDDGLQLECRHCQTPALLQTIYDSGSISIASHENGLYRYREWLPIRRSFSGVGRTITYRSERLSSLTGLRNLWIAFSGYWPEKGADLPTCTFKDLEAYSVLGRLPTELEQVLVIASAGNTAASFIRACSQNGIPCLVFIPEVAMRTMNFDVSIASCVKIVSLIGPADYSDAIRVADQIGSLPGFVCEGGARNVARRDGLATVLLSSRESIGALPDYYFQAVGSGTGAIAAHECTRRITQGEGPFPRLILSQNHPFTPIRDSWRSQSRNWTPIDERLSKLQIDRLDAKVLTNRHPPYSINGGLFDVLCQSEGEVLAINNEQLHSAFDLFEKTEGIDIDLAAAVAFASLLEKAVELEPDSIVLLNITGGGRKRLRSDKTLVATSPSLRISATDAMSSEGRASIAQLF